MTFRVLLDACVLVPYDLCNLLLTIAERGLFAPLWSQDILTEVEKALFEKLDVPPARARRRIEHMREAFPDAMIDGHRELIPAMSCHRKDRHVLAAAVKGHAQVLVTANIKDFPESSAAPYGIDVRHPDSFLWDQLDLDGAATTKAMGVLVARTNRPSLTVLDLMQRLRPVVPNFSQYVGGQLVRGEPISLATYEAALVQADPWEAAQCFVTDDRIDPTDPREVAYGWYVALCNLPEYLPAFNNLCYRPSDWPNPQNIANQLEDYGFASGVDRAIEAPDDIAFMRFIGDVGTVARVFEGGIVRGPQLVLTIVRCEDGTWRVFSLGPDYPSARSILG